MLCTALVIAEVSELWKGPKFWLLKALDTLPTAFYQIETRGRTVLTQNF